MKLSRVWLVTAGLVVVGFVFFHMEIIADGFVYLAVGRRALETGDLWASDDFSYTSSAVHRPLIIHFVGVVLAFAELERHFGLFSVIVVSTWVQAAAYLVAWLPHAKTRLAHLAAFLWTLFAIQLVSPDISTRGAVFGDLCFACMLLCLRRLQQGDRLHWLAPIAIGAVWANAHSSVPLAIVTPLFVAVSLRVLEPAADRPPLGPFARFAALAFLGAGLTPYSWLLPYDALLDVGRRDTWAIDLFLTPDMHRPIWIAAIAAGLALCAARGRFGPARQARADIALLVCFLVATCLWRRYASYMTMIATVLVARSANDLGDIRAGARLRTAIASVTIAVQVAVAAWFLRTPKDPFFHGPFAAAAFIEEHHLPDHVWARYDWGSYLMYAWGRRRKVFIDGWSTVFNNGVFDDDLAIANVAPDAVELLEAYDLNTLLCERGSPIHSAAANSQDWSLAYEDGRAVVYVRR